MIDKAPQLARERRVPTLSNVIAGLEIFHAPLGVLQGTNVRTPLEPRRIDRDEAARSNI